MYQEPLRILAVNPGTRYLGIAVFRGPELIDWGVKAVAGKKIGGRLKAALAVVRDLIKQYEPDAVAIKSLHRSRSSSDLNWLAELIKDLAQKRRLKIRRYSIGTLKEILCPQVKANKRKLAEYLAHLYPALDYDYRQEQENKHPYRIRMFEAVALGAVCYQQLEKNNISCK